MIKSSREAMAESFTSLAETDTEVLTTAQGGLVSDDQNSLRVGERGPTVLEDFHFREKIFHFDHKDDGPDDEAEADDLVECWALRFRRLMPKVAMHLGAAQVKGSQDQMTTVSQQVSPGRTLQSIIRNSEA